MTTSVITNDDNQERERLSVAYFTAIAAQSGCQLFQRDIDKQGIDFTMEPILGEPVKIDWQVKSCVNLSFQNGEASYALKVSNYRHLIKTNLDVPRLLLLYHVPMVKADRVTFGTSSTLSYCGYWCNLAGLPDTANQNTVSIKVLEANRLSVQTIVKMINSRYTNICNSVPGIGNV